MKRTWVRSEEEERREHESALLKKDPCVGSNKLTKRIRVSDRRSRNEYEEDRLCAEGLKESIGLVPIRRRSACVASEEARDRLCADEEEEKNQSAVCRRRVSPHEEEAVDWIDNVLTNEASKPVAGPTERYEVSIGSIREKKIVDWIDELTKSLSPGRQGYEKQVSIGSIHKEDRRLDRRAGGSLELPVN